jgi:hypothetical protein
MSRSILQVLVAAFVVASTLLACKGKPHDPANLTAIDSMLVQVDSLTRVVGTLDAAAYDRMDSVFDGQRSRIEMLLKDTLDRSVALAVGNYHRAMSRSLARVRSDREGMLQELARTRGKLMDLRHDVAGGLLPEGPERTYVDQERLFLASLTQRCTILLSSAGTVQRNWDEHHARVDSMLTATTPTP